MSQGEPPHGGDIGVLNNYANVFQFQVSEALQLASILPPVAEGWVYRADLVEQIATQLSVDGNGLTLSSVLARGDGGQGKSVLARLYANRYPKGCLILNCESNSLTKLFSDLFPAGLAKELSLPERAWQVRSALCSAKGFLVVFDNVEDPEHWKRMSEESAVPGNPNTRLMPSLPCHILVTCRHSLPSLHKVSVDQLSERECRELLSRFGVVAQSDDDIAVIDAILLETGRIALVVAAVGTALKAGDVSLSQYAVWLKNLPVDMFPDDESPDYDKKIGAILDDMLGKLPSAERRCLEYATYLPQDMIRENWLEALLEQDGVDRGKNAMRQQREPAAVIESLRRLNLLQESQVERLSLHRLLGKRIRERTNLKAEILEGIDSLVVAINDSGTRAGQEGYYSTALRYLNDFVLIQEGLLYEQAETLAFRNNLASAYTNRGNTQNGLGDLPAAKEDYDRAIALGEELRQILEPAGQWPPALRNNLATAYTNRAITLKKMVREEEAIRDFDRATEIRDQLS